MKNLAKKLLGCLEELLEASNIYLESDQENDEMLNRITSIIEEARKTIL